MTRPQKARLRRKEKEFFEVLKSLSEEQLRVITKYLDQCAIDHIGNLVHNLTKFENDDLSERDKKKLYKCLMGNTKLAHYLTKPAKNFEKKKKKLSQSGGFLATLLSVGIPILAEIIASQL
jgi:hypothetical protein